MTRSAGPPQNSETSIRRPVRPCGCCALSTSKRVASCASEPLAPQHACPSMAERRRKWPLHAHGAAPGQAVVLVEHQGGRRPPGTTSSKPIPSCAHAGDVVAAAGHQVAAGRGSPGVGTGTPPRPGRPPPRGSGCPAWGSAPSGPGAFPAGGQPWLILGGGAPRPRRRAAACPTRRSAPPAAAPCRRPGSPPPRPAGLQHHAELAEGPVPPEHPRLVAPPELEPSSPRASRGPRPSRGPVVLNLLGGGHLEPARVQQPLAAPSGPRLATNWVNRAMASRVR